MIGRAVVVVGVAVAAGCGGKSAPAAPVATAQPPPKVAPTPPACIAPLEDTTLPISHAAADGTRVKYCIGDTADQCFALDTETGAFEKLAAPPESAALANARIETTSPRLEVCQLDACKSLTPKILPAIAELRAATNAAGTVAVVLLGDAKAGKGYAEVWDVTTTKKLARFRYARGVFKCGDAAIIEDRIYVSASTCGAPSARGALYTLRGKRLALVGGADFGVYGSAYAQVDDKQWAFLEENGAKLVVHDLARGKLVQRIDTSPLFAQVGAAMGNPGESALVRLGPGKLAVIGGAPATGQVAVVDVASGEVQVLRAPVCGQP